MELLSDEWLSASASRNFCASDPLCDWLDLFGPERGYVPDNLREGFDPELEMIQFLREKGARFEAAVLDCIRDTFGVVRITESSKQAREPSAYLATLQAMEEGVEIIHQGALHDAERQLFGVPDLLVRSDVLNRLVDEPALSREELDMPRHYRVVDIKFTSVELNAKGLIGNDASDRRRKAQLLVYNRALGQAQECTPSRAYLIGRSWSQKLKGQSYRGDHCLERLAPADMEDPALHELVDAAMAWVRRVRTEGAGWVVLPEPSVSELYPNMSNTQDYPWHTAKQEIAEELGEVTLLWQVTPTHRPSAHAAGVKSWRNASSAGVFGISSDRTQKLERILEAQRDSAPLVSPPAVAAGRQDWHASQPLEFYVDFETVSDLDDDFTGIPKKGGQVLIFMIGCGHLEEGEWKFQVFTCDRLTQDCEREIIDAWHAHMSAVKERLMPGGDPLVFHWSHAERSFLDTAYNSARERHQRSWPDLNWYDFLVKVMREEPVVVKGALAFGLKAVARAMHQNGCLATNWTNGPGDGLKAMVGAWRCDAKAREEGGSMRNLELMKSIERYNEVDCRVMQEIVSYLRAHH
jgi:hypothetical protein